MNHEEMHYYSAALDEIWRLRRLLAYGADRVARIAAAGKTTGHRLADDARGQMISAAKGYSSTVLENLSDGQVASAVRDAGFEGSLALTRGMWEDEVDTRTPEWQREQIKARELAEREAQPKVEYIKERIKLANDLLDLQEHMTKLHKRACDGNADLLDASEAFIMWLAQGIKDVEAEVVGYTFTREGAALQVRKTVVIEVTTL